MCCNYCDNLKYKKIVLLLDVVIACIKLLLTLLRHSCNCFILQLTAGTLHVTLKHVVAKSTLTVKFEWVRLLLHVWV
jgi:hypothetical protein